ncbi:MAG: purine-nucleoside phosphorylase [Arcobacter sp.]|nr:MAG: purine-nucleoside phosphorylase [Arcobacter sp.]
MIVCAGDSETFSFAKTIGIGLVQSAMNLTRICMLDKPDSIIFIGSAGSYGDHNIFDIVESSSASNLELSFLDGNSYTPIDNILKGENEKFQNDTIVNSSNYITINEKLGKEYLQYGISIENMEFFSVVKIAKEFNIDVKGIFVITNYTNKDAHQDFILNHKEAMNKLIKELEQRKIIVPHGTKKDIK